MFRKKPERYRLEMTQGEARLLIAAMIHFRNRVARDGVPTEDIDELIVKLTRLTFNTAGR